MSVEIVVAHGTNRVIGNNGKLPWHLPADLKRFRDLTMGHPVIMGRKTYESIGSPLRGRENIIVSRQKLLVPGCYVAGSLEEAIAHAKLLDPRVFVIGGAEIYRLALPYTQRVHETYIFRRYVGDAKFPRLSQKDWKLFSQEQYFPTNGDMPPYAFYVHERRSK